jgi:hypothetical protein
MLIVALPTYNKQPLVIRFLVWEATDHIEKHKKKMERKVRAEQKYLSSIISPSINIHPIFSSDFPEDGLQTCSPDYTHNPDYETLPYTMQLLLLQFLEVSTPQNVLYHDTETHSYTMLLFNHLV